ncbi:hypothetical protein EW145_g8639, partial [Phellinidium pouzarii]
MNKQIHEEALSCCSTRFDLVAHSSPLAPCTSSSCRILRKLGLGLAPEPRFRSTRFLRRRLDADREDSDASCVHANGPEDARAACGDAEKRARIAAADADADADA